MNPVGNMERLVVQKAFAMTIGKISVIRPAMVLAALLNGTLSLLFAIAGFGIVTHAVDALGNARLRDEFAVAFVFKGLGLGAFLLAIFLGSLAIGCYILYRRTSETRRTGLKAIVFLVVAIIPPFLFLILLVKGLP